MVQATFIVSALFALAVVVSAVPHGSLLDADIGYIGTKEIHAEGALNRVVNANNLQADHILENIQVADDGLDVLRKRSANMAVKGKRVKMAKKSNVAMKN